MTSKRRNAGVAGGVAAALALPAILVGTPAMADETAPVEDPSVSAAESEVPAHADDVPEVAGGAGGDAADSTVDATPATSAAPAAESAVVESITIPMPAVEDAEAPVIAAVTPGDGAFVSGKTTFAVDVVDSNISYSYIEFHKDGRWLTDATKEEGSRIHGNSPQLVLDTTRFPDGVYGLKITSTDTHGNSTYKTTSVVVDNTKPVLSSNLTDGQWVTKKQDVVLTVTEAHPFAYHAQLYGPDGAAVDAVKAYTYAPTTGTLTLPAVNWSDLPEGDYRMVFSARDKSGNRTSLTVGLRHDEKRPSLELTGNDFVLPSAPGSVDFSATDGYALSRIDANLYDAENAKMLRPLGSKGLSGISATGSFALPAGLADGTYTLRATVRDVEGNTRTVPIRFTVKTPVAPVDGSKPVTPDAPLVPDTPTESGESNASGEESESSAPAKAAVAAGDTTVPTEAAGSDETERTETPAAGDERTSTTEAAASKDARDADAETESGPSNWWIAMIAGVGSMFAGLFAKRRLSR